MHPEINVHSLITGSQRINEMTSQISQIISMLFGLIRKEDLKGRKYQEKVFEFSTPDGFNWEVIHCKSTLDCKVSKQDFYEFLYVCNLSLPRWAVLPIYRGLEQFIMEMLKAFPQLEGRLQALVEASKLKPID
jgi:hypothetical protein